MNKEQYATVLERELRRSNDEKVQKAKKEPFYKAINKSIEKLEQQIKALKSKRDAQIPDYSWNESTKRLKCSEQNGTT